eukprot:TRINITY_DN823_c0_g1_i1.p1 TRINITY_DN823_c0_g1~~TRINITY_DN823_c0_g1_i1.p1  ORF type:complete len:323 (-),score=58.27 TRINITY_DN823_c0_g1_i1:77-1045(-)
MGATTKRTDYHWTYTDEPHATRRKLILAKYPQIKELYGYDTRTKYIVLAWVLAQFTVALLLRDAAWWVVLTCAYFFGTLVTHSLVLGMHEISHNLAFAKPLHNRLLGVFANLPTVVPHFSMFQKYHMEHHQYQGVSGIDSDVPSEWEGRFFVNSFLKALWVFFQPFFYVIRPFFIKPKSPGFWEAINWSCVILVDIIIVATVGWRSLAYMFVSVYMGSGFHPIAGHFIAEHYVFLKGQETYSYYGPFNWICFNVGYHNEHHDFPRVPGYKLPELRAIAPEYYDPLPHYNSWGKVIYNYISDPEVGPFSRVMRKSNRMQRKEE